MDETLPDDQAITVPIPTAKVTNNWGPLPVSQPCRRSVRIIHPSFLPPYVCNTIYAPAYLTLTKTSNQSDHKLDSINHSVRIVSWVGPYSILFAWLLAYIHTYIYSTVNTTSQPAIDSQLGFHLLSAVYSIGLDFLERKSHETWDMIRLMVFLVRAHISQQIWRHDAAPKSPCCDSQNILYNY